MTTNLLCTNTVLMLISTLSACAATPIDVPSSSTRTNQTPAVRAPEPESASIAIELARRCAAENPSEYESVGGSPLLFENAVASSRINPATGSSVWIVVVPEAVPTSIPSGRDIVVDIQRGVCEGALML